MNNNFNFHLIFAFTTITYLLMDMIQFFTLGTVIAPLLLSSYCALLTGNLRHGPLLFIAITQCLESFCFYNHSLLPFIYLIPMTLFAVYCKKNLYPSYAHGITFALVCIVTNLYIIEGLLLHITPTTNYTIMKIGVTLLLEVCFSLTINYWGMQDNRA